MSEPEISEPWFDEDLQMMVVDCDGWIIPLEDVEFLRNPDGWIKTHKKDMPEKVRKFIRDGGRE